MTGNGPRVGVLACSCWSRSQAGIDADAIVARALLLPQVTHAEATDDLCGVGHAALAGDLVRRHSLDRLVVAACACCPQDQRCPACSDERASLREAVKGGTGLPWAHHAFVNVKDHARDVEDSVILVSMAVARLAATPQEVPARATKEPVRAALVVGAGSVGRAAAVELGERGIPTHLVDHASPAGSGAGAPLNITLHVPARVIGISGGAGDFTISISRLGMDERVRVGAMLVAPGLAEEQRGTAVGWGLPHQSMAKPPRRVSGAFLATEDSMSAAGVMAAFLGRDIRGDEALATVDAEACIGCLKCERVCPYNSIGTAMWDMDAGASRWSDHIARVDPFLCAGCGACASACLNWAVDQVGFTTRELEAAIRAGAEGTQTMLVVCNWAAYRALDRAYADGMLPHGLAILRLPCLARLSPHLVQVALDAGADPLIIAGCSERGCHYRGRRGMVEEHLENMELALSRGGCLERVFVLALGPTDKDVLASRVAEAMEERRYAREDRDAVDASELRSTDWSRGWG